MRNLAKLTQVEVLLENGDPVPQFELLEVGLHVGDLDVGFLRVQLAQFDDLGVLYDDHIVSPELLAVKVLQIK